MRLKIFVSWSQKRSQALGQALVDWIPLVLPNVNFWMSADDIPIGTPWYSSIGTSLLQCRFGVVCVTPENADSAWLSFEAGVILGAMQDTAKICPLFLGVPELSGPLQQFQGTDTSKAGIRKLITTLNSAVGKSADPIKYVDDRFDKYWPKLRLEIKKIEETPLGAVAIPSVLKAFARKQDEFSKPVWLTTVHFEKGFESHALYEAASSIAKKRLLIFGRKNRKLFDKDHLDFLVSLPDRVKKGFEFRCLFLDPDSDPHVISSAHQDIDFGEQLRLSIEHAWQILSRAGLDPDAHCRTYSVQRSFRGLILDDAVLHSHIRYQGSVKPLPFTKSSFSVDSVGSHAGKDFLDEFSCLWETGHPISEALRTTPS